MNTYYHPIGLVCPQCNRDLLLFKVLISQEKLKIQCYCKKCKDKDNDPLCLDIEFNYPELLGMALRADKLQNEQEDALNRYEQQMHEFLHPETEKDGA